MFLFFDQTPETQIKSSFYIREDYILLKVKADLKTPFRRSLPIIITNKQNSFVVANAYLIDKDQNQELMVAELAAEIVGTFQLSYLQYLTYQGGLRVLVEAVRVKDAHRGKGLGALIFKYIIKLARERGAHMVQLTSNKERTDARRFYSSMGFEESHEGFKLHL